MVENATVAPINGISAKPDWPADICSTTSKYSGTKIVMPTNVPMLQAPASAAHRTTGLPRTVNGRKGSRVDTSLQANNPHKVVELKRRAPIAPEIQSKRR